MMKIELDAIEWDNAVAQELLNAAENPHTSPKMREALLASAVYHMTYDDCVKYFGCEETAREYFYYGENA